MKVHWRTQRLVKQLKKMTIETLHARYEKVTGRTMFNPYEERELMIVEIMGHLGKVVKSGTTVTTLLISAIKMKMLEIMREVKAIRLAVVETYKMAECDDHINSFFGGAI